MQRLWRWAGHACAGTSLVLFAVATVMCARSWFLEELDHGAVVLGGSRYEAIVQWGRLRLERQPGRWVANPFRMFPGDPDVTFETEMTLDWPAGERSKLPPARETRFFSGFEAEIRLTRTGRHRVTLAVPAWFILLATAYPPLRWAWRRRREALLRRRRQRGRCRACGYDLRATPQVGGALLARCPECGTDVPGASGELPSRDGRAASHAVS